MLPGLKVNWDAGGRFRVVDLVGSSSVIGGFGAEAPVVTVKSAVLKALLKKFHKICRDQNLVLAGVDESHILTSVG
jgi:hypothetical protein